MLRKLIPFKSRILLARLEAIIARLVGCYELHRADMRHEEEQI
jgi:hypothetical protein